MFSELAGASFADLIVFGVFVVFGAGVIATIIFVVDIFKGGDE